MGPQLLGTLSLLPVPQDSPPASLKCLQADRCFYTSGSFNRFKTNKLVLIAFSGS